MADVDQELARHAVQYEASAIPKFRRAMRALTRQIGHALQSYTFIDFGSGKALVVMLASRYPFKQVCGVEMSPALHEIAQTNVRQFAARRSLCAPVQLTCGDALAFAWPEGGIVAYLYNPFDETLTARFIDRLTAETAATNRSIYVIYVNPAHRALFEANPAFHAIYQHVSLCVYQCASASQRHDEIRR
jgi:hypothetical protein